MRRQVAPLITFGRDRAGNIGLPAKYSACPPASFRSRDRVGARRLVTCTQRCGRPPLDVTSPVTAVCQAAP